MRQVQIAEWGGPEVLQTVVAPDPFPAAGQVLITVEAAGITFVETQLRAGRPPWPGPLPALPLVPGNGVAGKISAVGPGVDKALIGTRVVSATGGSGGYSELVAVPAADPVPIPGGMSAGAALALLADGRTAYALARAAELTAGDRVLVLAAAGGVGSLLLQLAKSAGVDTVIAAASTSEKLRLAVRLGADLTADYSEPDWADKIAAALGDVTVVFDGVGGELAEAARDLAGVGARVLIYGGASGAMANLPAGPAGRFTVTRGNTIVRSPADNRGLVIQALADAVAGKIEPVVGQRFDLGQAAAAHAAIESRATQGKTYLVC